MTKREMADLLSHIQSEENLVREAGQSEYSHDENNCFANFDRVADSLKLDRKQVLLVYALKHWDGIVSYVGGHKSQREDVRGRIKDLRMYLALLWGMIEEESEDLAFNTVSITGSTITTAINRRTHSDCGRTNCTGCPECEG